MSKDGLVVAEYSVSDKSIAIWTRKEKCCLSHCQREEMLEILLHCLMRLFLFVLLLFVLRLVLLLVFFSLKI